MARRSSNTTAVPEAMAALDRFKYEVANEIGVPLSEGYNGNLTSKQNGSVGGYMVKKMIEQQERQMSGGSNQGQF
ncbi:alpha/beta-type small acid-soluble spore protein [Blautia liquoris]|jgi:hypothetical protein|uniref:Alpha/beta-type small acid-soluble spore protein n=1 Tax=Blautia liquoris TaxID=2779518 RepID=A0A7M2RK99_9FIRM|nr:alpha/beta-type small acid-soluble spore protein [Blautia liquoris]QOV20753.1 alpha/beta-type small acid-soluble spore protein [Blautia liquoris]